MSEHLDEKTIYQRLRKLLAKWLSRDEQYRQIIQQAKNAEHEWMRIYMQQKQKIEHLEFQNAIYQMQLEVLESKLREKQCQISPTPSSN